jgi:arylsulfatase A-like enzyme
MVSHLDLFPTICDLLGRQADHPLEGRSLLPLVRGETDRIHDAIFTEQTHHAEWTEPLRAIRSERYKYVLHHFETGPRMEGSRRPGGRILAEAGFYHRQTGKEELFDLYLDPHEARNCIDDPALQHVRQDLKARLDAWMAATHDPFHHGALPPHA